MFRYFVSCLFILVVIACCGYYFFSDYWERRFDELIARHARVYRLDEKLVWSVIYEETYFRAGAIGDDDEVGLMQITPLVAREWAKETGLTEMERRANDDVIAFLSDPERNIQIGCWYLEKVRERYRGRPAETAMMLGAYNAGASRVEEWTRDADAANLPEADFISRIGIGSTKAYVTSILARYREASARAADGSAARLQMKILTAEYVVPISSDPIRSGAVAIDGDKIAAVGTRDDVMAQYPNASVEEFGVAAILPGLVNCHAHLELTAMRGALDNVEHDFRSWLLKINELRAGLSDEDIVRWAIAGAREGAAAGVTCFGDIGRFGHAGVAALNEVGLRGIVFQETEFSPDNATADDDFRKLGEKFEKLKEEETDLVKVGLSPHSPYTVGSRLFELIAQYSIINRVPLTIHAAESSDEDDLMMRGEGLFAEFASRAGLEWNSPHCTPVEYLERLGVLSTRPLLAHCVTVSDSDIKRIKSNGAKIAHCPKSNAKFGHGYAPFEKFLDAGILVGLGSDSVASNNVCDLLEESRFAALAARNHPDRKRFISAREALEAATLGGAKTLGLDNVIGTLETGKQADIAVLSLDHHAQQPVSDIYAALVFSSSGRDVVRTLVGGQQVSLVEATKPIPRLAAVVHDRDN